MSLTGKDKPRTAGEFISWLATSAQSQPELRERLIGDQVRQARRSAGLTQLELARTLRIALSKLSRYEGGLDKMPPRQHYPGPCGRTPSAAGRPEVVTAT